MPDEADDSPPARASNAAPLLGTAQTFDRAEAMVEQLSRVFREQVRRALGVELDDTVTSLAFVDHYLHQARGEPRDSILALVAAGAGAYYGELVRREAGGTWIGDGMDPRSLRLLLRPQFLYFSPIDQALEAITGETLDPEDPRIPAGPAFDSAFHLEPVAPHQEGDEAHDSVWLEARLGELPGVPEDQFHTLTCRFETLTLMLELLATKHLHEGRGPAEHALEHYLHVIATVH